MWVTFQGDMKTVPICSTLTRSYLGRSEKGPFVSHLKTLVVMACAFLAMALGASPAHAADVVLDRGHVDVFHVAADGSQLKLALREDVTGQHVVHDPANVTLTVGENTRTEDTAQVAEIGTGGYYLPQTQESDRLWPGWDTNDVKQGGFSAVDITITDINGPGDVWLFQQKGFGGVEPVFSGGDFTMKPGSVIAQAEPSHVHASWLFTEPGNYTMKVKASAGGTESNEATYTWQVGGASSGSEKKSDQPQPVAASQQSATPKQQQAAPAPAANSGSNGNTGNTGNTGSTQKCSPGLLPRVKDDRTSSATWKDPASLSFGLGNEAKARLPQAIGPVPAGDVWMIGSVQQAGVPWLGANTQHPSLLQHTTGEVTWTITGFNGPGPMAVFTQGGLGQVVGEEWFRAANGKAQGSHTIPANTHVHPSWVFGKPGTYKVTVTQTAKTKSGQTVSGAATLTFVVGGQGNANNGHFDFGALYDDQANCGTGPASGTGGASGASSTGGGSLADTGMSIMTIPFAILGLGVLVFGAGMVRVSRKLFG